MADSKQKKKLMCGMTVGKARRKFLQIWKQANPTVGFTNINKDFKARVPTASIWVWFETWFRLRAHNDTFDAIAQAFAEKIKSMHKQKQALEQTVHLQRLELRKRLAEIDELKGIIQGLSDMHEGKTKPFKQVQAELEANTDLNG